MKTLRKMKVINWHYFDEEEIAFGAATMLSGHSVEARLCLTSDKEILQRIQQCGLTCTAVS